MKKKGNGVTFKRDHESNKLACNVSVFNGRAFDNFVRVFERQRQENGFQLHFYSLERFPLSPQASFEIRIQDGSRPIKMRSLAKIRLHCLPQQSQ